MDNLITSNNGGFPVVLDDLRFNQQSTRDAFYGFLSAFGVSAADSFIISGCNLSGTYQPGYISLFGEILRFDGQVHPGFAIGYTNVWDVSVTYDPAGSKTMEGGTTVQSYQVRKAYIKAEPDATAANYLSVSSAKTLEDKITAMLGGEDWIDVPASDARYRKDKLGFVHLVGLIGQNGLSTFTLPVGYRPASGQTFRVFWIDSPNSSHNDVTISTAGVVTSPILSGAGTDRNVSLSGISFKHI